ncbi:hypothetical protein EJO68_33345 [Variovorax atrisoli]|uniref:hypothetical protein n=1 Tax=Variovorax atrisoli TaxID=3394203 RepID=UPI000F7E7263|nr:hypothetical protein [Variovorax sp. 369]RTD84024.1 hypothetical protein EJO68_33345 [Variovorax sp. 369]
MNSKLVEYSDAILSAKPGRSEGAFSRAAESFEDDLLDFSDFPEDYFAFVLRVLSDDAFFLRAGAWNFLLILGTEKEKLQQAHYDQLAEAIVTHYPFYLNEDLCLAACDFIARNYPEAYARRVLNRLREIEKQKDPSLLGFATDGLRILELEVARTSGADRGDRTVH